MVAAMSMVYVLTTHIPKYDENAIVDQVRRKNKWDNDNYICRGLILKGMSDPLFNIYQNVKSTKELQDSLEAKYMVEDASKLQDSLEAKYMVEDASSKKIIDKLPSSWKYFKHTLKHNKEKLTLVDLGSHLRIEESLRAQDSNKPKGTNVDAIFDKNRFSTVPRPSQRSLINGTDDIGGLVFPKEATEEVVTQQPEPDLRKGKRNRTPKNFRPEFQLYLIKGTRDEVSDQRSYCFNIKDGPKTFDEAMKSQDEASDESAGLQKGIGEIIEHKTNGALYYLDRIWVPLKGDVRTLIIDETHKSKYSVHPRADKMYYDLRDRIAMDFVTKLPRTSSGHDTIWVIVNRLTTSAHFLPMREDYKMDRLARLYLNEIVARHGPELVQETIKKISHIKDRLKAVGDCQKSYADKRRKPLEFSVGDYVLLKVSPRKGVSTSTYGSHLLSGFSHHPSKEPIFDPDPHTKLRSCYWYVMGRLKNLTRKEFCLSNGMQKLEIELLNHIMVEAGHAAYTDRFHELARLVPQLVTPENKRINRGNDEEPSRDRNVKDDNKRTRTGNAFSTTTNPVRRENTGMTPKCTTCSFYHPPEAPCRTCFNCNRPGNIAKDCRVVPRNVNPINARNPAAARGACYEYGGTNHYKSACPRLNQAQGMGVNRPNQALAIDGGQGRRNNDNQAHGRAFMMGAEEARQDPNIMTGIKPSDLGFSYEIEIASRQIVK
nr:zinc finger, CCHC-type [Tanacetum cinerariifolium]